MFIEQHVWLVVVSVSFLLIIVLPIVMYGQRLLLLFYGNVYGIVHMLVSSEIGFFLSLHQVLLFYLYANICFSTLSGYEDMQVETES